MLIRALLLALVALPALAQTRADPEPASGLAPKPLVEAQRYMIAAAHPLAAEAGAAVLARGGSAADAAITALLVLNVVEPQSSGIGGGAFALVHAPDGLIAWDARETAPMAVGPDLFLEDGAPLPFLTAVASGRSVGVPGLVRLIEVLHARHGRLDWAELFAPAIRLAEEGFPVSPRLAASVEGSATRLAEAPAGALFLPEGKPLEEGAVFRNPALAATLRLVADQGADAFYSGPLAAEIVAAVTAGPRPGAMTLEDLAAYEVKPRAPVCMAYRARFRVCGMGPPSSGATTVGQILGLLDRFKPDELTLDDDRLWHLFAEASRLAYADRAKYLADSDVVKVPVAGLLDAGYLAARARLMPPFEASQEKAEAGDPPWREGRYAPGDETERPGTTHLSVIDADGMAISVTASIEIGFGSGRMAGGFLLNNQLTDFSFSPVGADGAPVANAPGPGKRPRSSMAPTMVYEGDRLAVLTGSPGGSRIPEYVAQNLIALLDFRLDPATAASLPHVSHRNGDELVLEPGFPETLAERLAARRHAIAWKEMTSGLHTISMTPEGGILGGADPRREGVAIGQ